MMKVTVLKKDKEKMRFVMEGTSIAMANSLRRVMATEVPVMAIETVDIIQNTSVLFDEVLASRLGMLPLSYDPAKTGKEAVFHAEKKGPGTLYSGELKGSDPGVKPLSPDFPIVELLKNHQVSFEARTAEGIGKDHAKFQAANAYYLYVPESVYKSRSKFTKVCKDHAGFYTGNKTVTDPDKCEMCKAVQEAGREGPVVFLFTVDSVSGLKPDYIASKSGEILAEKADEFTKLAKKL